MSSKGLLMPKKLRNCLRNKSENSKLKRTSMNYKAPCTAGHWRK